MIRKFYHVPAVKKVCKEHIVEYRYPDNFGTPYHVVWVKTINAPGIKPKVETFWCTYEKAYECWPEGGVIASRKEIWKEITEDDAKQIIFFESL